jgi:pyridoxal phosphate enzyme (YggS family)
VEPASSEIADRLEAVRRRIRRAADRSGRAIEGVRLVVVTKGHPASKVRQAYAAGVRWIGENRLEEAEAKMAGLQDLQDLEWHLIGPLQSRKARHFVRGFVLVHAIDRLKTARLVSEAALRGGWCQDVLLELNVSGEPSKAGWNLGREDERRAWLADAETVAALEGIRLRGLMTMAPQDAAPEVQHIVFGGLRDARRTLQERVGMELPELSMGMSDDFEAAIEDGATLVRIGRAILGERMYT